MVFFVVFPRLACLSSFFSPSFVVVLVLFFMLTTQSKPSLPSLIGNLPLIMRA